MTTAQELITDSLSNIGAIGRGVTASGFQGIQALRVLNRMLNSWSSKGLLIPSRTIEQLAISSSKASYTIGSGGDFDTPWPMSILSMFIRQGGVDYTISPMTNAQYNAITNKAVSGRPDRYYYEPAYSLGTIYFNLSPATSDTIHITSLKPLTQISSLGTTLTLPPDFELALEFNLSLMLIPKYGKTGASLNDVRRIADESLTAIENRVGANRVPLLKADSALTGNAKPYDINSG